jgi:hypothetical protein
MSLKQVMIDATQEGNQQTGHVNKLCLTVLNLDARMHPGSTEAKHEQSIQHPRGPLPWMLHDRAQGLIISSTVSCTCVPVPLVRPPGVLFTIGIVPL